MMNTTRKLAASGLLSLLAAVACSSQPTDDAAASSEGSELGARAACGQETSIRNDARYASIRDVAKGKKAKAVEITILSDMAVDRWSHAEWGFSALVSITDADGNRRHVLFDTGASRDVVLYNLGNDATKPLGERGGNLMAKVKPRHGLADICAVEDVVLSHNHQDHTLGLNGIRKYCLDKGAANGLKRAHTGGPDIFRKRPIVDGSGAVVDDDNVFSDAQHAVKTTYEGLGGTFVPHTGPAELFPGVWLTGPIVRTSAEKNYDTEQHLDTPTGPIDTVPEDQALVIDTEKGLVVVSGCAHAGVVNTIRQAVAMTGDTHVYGLVGGLHLMKSARGDQAAEGTLDWTGTRLGCYGISQLLGAHCTGFDRVTVLRDFLNLPAESATQSTVGSYFQVGAPQPEPDPNANVVPDADGIAATLLNTTGGPVPSHDCEAHNH